MSLVTKLNLQVESSDPNNTYIDLAYLIHGVSEPQYIPIDADLDIDIHNIEIDNIDRNAVCDALNQLILTLGTEINTVIQNHVLGFDGRFSRTNIFNSFHNDFSVIKYWQNNGAIAVVLEKRTDTRLRLDRPSLKFKNNSEYMDWYESTDYEIENAIESLQNMEKAC